MVAIGLPSVGPDFARSVRLDRTVLKFDVHDLSFGKSSELCEALSTERGNFTEIPARPRKVLDALVATPAAFLETSRSRYDCNEFVLAEKESIPVSLDRDSDERCFELIDTLSEIAWKSFPSLRVSDFSGGSPLNFFGKPGLTLESRKSASTALNAAFGRSAEAAGRLSVKQILRASASASEDACKSLQVS